MEKEEFLNEEGLEKAFELMKDEFDKKEDNITPITTEEINTLFSEGNE